MDKKQRIVGHFIALFTVFIWGTTFVSTKVLLEKLKITPQKTEKKVQQVDTKSMIMDGTLSAGEALPSMRALAKDLHLSVITVQRAYEDLTRDGLISVR